MEIIQVQTSLCFLHTSTHEDTDQTMWHKTLLSYACANRNQPEVTIDLNTCSTASIQSFHTTALFILT